MSHVVWNTPSHSSIHAGTVGLPIPGRLRPSFAFCLDRRAGAFNAATRAEACLGCHPICVCVCVRARACVYYLHARPLRQPCPPCVEIYRDARLADSLLSWMRGRGRTDGLKVRGTTEGHGLMRPMRMPHTLYGRWPRPVPMSSSNRKTSIRQNPFRRSEETRLNSSHSGESRMPSSA